MIKIIKGDCFSRSELFGTVTVQDTVEQAVKTIIEKVKAEGDKALFEYTEKFDGVSLSSLAVTDQEIESAYASVDTTLLRVLETAKKNIYDYHKHQIPNGFIIDKGNGILLGQRYTPIEKAGLYVPGGTAAYPSTVLMDAIPAKLAGVKELVMTTPPQKDGTVNPVILAAAKIAGVDRIYKVGGAQAIAALAFGTLTVPAVYKIVGPGNAYVAEAKKQVFGKVDIDMIAGPSEILIIADSKSNPVFVAADMLSQSEHDKMSTSILLTESECLANAVAKELEKQLLLLPRQDIARASVDTNSKIIVLSSIEKAISLSNEIAPEHLELCVDDPMQLLDSVTNAGSIFLGRYCPEPLGDYYSGTNHTLPTSGTAKFASPLSVDDFVKKTAFTMYSKENLSEVADDIVLFAESEGLHAHAKAVSVRFEDDRK